MTLVGMDALKRAVTESPTQLRGWMSEAIRESTFSVADRMRKLVPTSEGHLLTSIEAKVPARTGLYGRVEIASSAYYWRFLEYGTVKMTARPFIRPATEWEAPFYLDRVREVGRKLERFWERG